MSAIMLVLALLFPPSEDSPDYLCQVHGNGYCGARGAEVMF